MYAFYITFFNYILFAITPNKAIQPLKSKEGHKGGNYDRKKRTLRVRF